MFNRLFDRKGRTDILIPSIGVPALFGEIRAGDFFMESGRLHLKINLEHAVEILSDDKPIIGTSVYSANHTVFVVNVQIEIKAP